MAFSILGYIFLSTRNNSIDPCYIIGLRWPSQTRPLYQFLLVHQPEVYTLPSLNTQIYIFKLNDVLDASVLHYNNYSYYY